MGDHALRCICRALSRRPSKFLGWRGVPAAAGWCGVNMVDALTALSLMGSRFC